MLQARISVPTSRLPITTSDSDLRVTATLSVLCDRVTERFDVFRSTISSITSYQLPATSRVFCLFGGPRGLFRLPVRGGFAKPKRTRASASMQEACQESLKPPLVEDVNGMQRISPILAAQRDAQRERERRAGLGTHSHADGKSASSTTQPFIDSHTSPNVGQSIIGIRVGDSPAHSSHGSHGSHGLQ